MYGEGLAMFASLEDCKVFLATLGRSFVFGKRNFHFVYSDIQVSYTI